MFAMGAMGSAREFIVVKSVAVTVNVHIAVGTAAGFEYYIITCFAFHMYFDIALTGDCIFARAGS